MEKGLVIKSHGSWYGVKIASGEVIECKIKGKFRLKGIRTTNPIAVGDHVEFKYVTEDANSEGRKVGLITKIDERKNYIIRKASNLSKESHIIASNIDQAFLIVTVNYPPTSTGFIDRFLVSAEAYRIPVNLVFNKIDRYNEEDQELLAELISIYEPIGYKCFVTSAKQDINMDILRESMAGKINVLAGHSGVGKSTIINVLYPELNLRTAEISDSHKKGKHTTTHAEMYEMENGGYIIDTPGIKGFGMIEMEKEEISHYFPEIFQRLKACQFHNCTHTHEPGCAVKEAVANGEIAESRYINYLTLLEDEGDKYRLR